MPNRYGFGVAMEGVDNRTNTFSLHTKVRNVINHIKIPFTVESHILIDFNAMNQIWEFVPTRHLRLTRSNIMKREKRCGSSEYECINTNSIESDFV